MLSKHFSRLSLITLLLSLLAFTFHPAAAQLSADPAQVIANAVAYLKTQQQPDGGILGFAGTSDPDTTIRTVLALVANGQPLDGFTSPEGSSLRPQWSALPRARRAAALGRGSGWRGCATLWRL